MKLLHQILVILVILGAVCARTIAHAALDCVDCAGNHDTLLLGGTKKRKKRQYRTRCSNDSDCKVGICVACAIDSFAQE